MQCCCICLLLTVRLLHRLEKVFQIGFEERELTVRSHRAQEAPAISNLEIVSTSWQEGPIVTVTAANRLSS